MTEKDIDQTSGIETTGHEWDGIKELNNHCALVVVDVLCNDRLFNRIYDLLPRYPAYRVGYAWIFRANKPG